MTPHQLRHTFATQLVNAGCKITTIQALLGYKRLNTTLTYARVHDQTVAEDYLAAMAVVEKRLADQLPLPEQDMGRFPTPNGVTNHLLALGDSLNQEPLTESQQALVMALQQELTALLAPANGAVRQMNHFVNEPATLFAQPVALP